MSRADRTVGLSVLLCFSFYVIQSAGLLAKDNELKPEELIAAHIKSVGTPEALSAVKTRSVSGNVAFKFITGATGQLQGKAQIVSEKGKMGIVMRLGGTEYPGEHFAYDGNDVMVDNVKPGQRSPLGDFLYRYNGIMKNGLLGSTLYVGWPLLNTAESKPRMKCRKKKVDNRELYELEYTPQKSMADVKVKMYFDPESFRHVMTEHRVRLQLNESVTTYVLLEKFDDFRNTDGLTLPYKYSLDFSYEAAGGSLVTRYDFEAEKFSTNGNIDPRFYVAEK